MKCESCKKEINLTIFGITNNICWGCLKEEQKKDIVSENLKVVKNPKKINCYHQANGKTYQNGKLMNLLIIQIYEKEKST